MPVGNLLACNLGSYGKYRENALAHLASLGVRHVEIPVPKPEEVESTRARLAEHGLSASTLLAPCDASSDPGVEQFAGCLPAARALGVATLFVSVKQGEASLAECYGRLRRMAEAASTAGLRLAVETHPPFAHNAGAALATLRAVDHQNLRLNYDTGNVYFYNEGTDAVRELEPVAEHVVAVHLKDTNGGCRSWHFPALGEGVVNFPAVFHLLNARGFHGPFTMELEGIQGETLTEAQQQARVAQSAAYLRSQGLVE